MNASSNRTLSKSEYHNARTALREFQSGLEELYGEATPNILVYGSYARGQPGSESDIDILLLFPDKIHPGEEIRRVNWILADLNLRYQVLISVLPASASEYQYSSVPFWENVRRESVPIDAI